MKKLLIILGIALLAVTLHAQNSTVSDMGTYITLNYDSGDTVSVAKEGLLVISKSTRIYLVPSSGSNNIQRNIVLDYDDFGYSTNTALRLYLETLCFRSYNQVFSYDGSSNLDTIHYQYGGVTQYSDAFTYSGGNLATKQIVTY